MKAAASTLSYPAWIRTHKVSLGVALLCGLALRLWICLHFAHYGGDSPGYEKLAENMTAHHAYSIGQAPDLPPTDARMPGYPIFLALVYAIFGKEQQTAVRIIQGFLDATTILLTGWIAWQLSPQATRLVIFAAALQPFTAEYTASILTETCAIFFSTAALAFMLDAYRRNKERNWALSGLAAGAAILCRPDCVLLLAGAGILILALVVRRIRSGRPALYFSAGLLLLWAPWIVRNLISLREFQPLANFYAAEPGEFSPRGFLRWTQTWLADDRFLDTLLWRVDERPIDFAALPGSAFDSNQERNRVRQLITRYNETLDMSPELDRQFSSIAAARIARHPVKFFLGLPLKRALILWFTPHYGIFPLTEELLPLSNLIDDPRESIWIDVLFLFKALVAVFAVLALLFSDRWVSLWGAGSILIRTAAMAMLPNTEYRYVLEIFPLLLALAGAGVWMVFRKGTQEV
ncbi:MAG TPA: glycosyltransferase family 39 protein [Acidobacteriota bacterium]|jgi:hypothetical protein